MLDEIYLNMNGRLVRIVEEGPVRHSIGDVFCTKLMEDMWTGRIFKPEDSNDVYIAATFDCEMEILALMARGPLSDE